MARIIIRRLPWESVFTRPPVITATIIIITEGIGTTDATISRTALLPVGNVHR
jgi:hypothetical protein